MATQTFVIQVQMQGGKQVTQQLNQIQQAAVSTERSVSQTARTMAFFRNALVALSAVRVVTGITEFADTVVNMDNRLRVATKSQEEFTRAQAFLRDISMQTRTAIDDNAVVYSRMLRSTEGLGFSTKELESAMEGVTLAIKVGGATSQEARNSLIQFSQSLASGALRGDELRSVAEQLPGLADAIGKEFGVAGGQLLAFAKANPGILETERVMRGVIAAVPELRAQFATMSVSIGDGFTMLRTGALLFLQSMNNASGVFGALGQALAFVGANFQTFGNAILFVSLILGVKFAYEAVGAAIAALGRLGVALMANPFGLIAAAIVAVVGLLYTFKDVSETAQAIVDSFTKTLYGWIEAWFGADSAVAQFLKRLFNLDPAVQSTNDNFRNLTKTMKDLQDEADKSGDKINKLNTVVGNSPRIVSAYSNAAFTAADANIAVGQTSLSGASGLNTIAGSYNGAASAANNYASAARAASSAGGGGGGGGGGPGGTAGGSYTSKVGMSRSELESSQAAIRQATSAAISLKAQEAAYMALADRRDLSSEVKNKAFAAAQQYAKDLAAGMGGSSIGKLQLQYLGLQDIIKRVEKAANNVKNDQNRMGGNLGGGYGLGTSKLVGAFLEQTGSYGQLGFSGGGGFSGSPGFQTGGSFQVGGSGGPDSQFVGFRASPGEMVKISKKDPGTGETKTINITAQVIVPDVKTPEDFNRNQAYIESVMAQTMRRATARN